MENPEKCKDPHGSIRKAVRYPAYLLSPHCQSSTDTEPTHTVTDYFGKEAAKHQSLSSSVTLAVRGFQIAIFLVTSLGH